MVFRFAWGQLRKAQIAEKQVADAEAQARAEQRVASWLRVLTGVATGKLKIGSATPVRGFPAWLTPQVIRGGFVTGRAAAGGPLEADEIALAQRLGIEPNRASLFAWFQSDDGRRQLDAWLDSGSYRLDLPEHGALLAVAWLRQQDHMDNAAHVLGLLEHWSSRVRFWPYELEQPEVPGVHIATLPAVAHRLAGKRPQSRVEAERTTLSVWNPFCDKVLDHWLAARRADGAIGELFSASWIEGAKNLRAEYRQLTSEHTLPKRHADTSGTLQLLLAGFQAPLEGYSDVPAMARAQTAVSRALAKRGEPGSPQFKELRAQQAHIAALPSHASLAHEAAARLNSTGSGGAVADPLALLDGLPAADLPAVRKTARQATQAPLPVLLRERIVRSAESLATLAPQLTAETVAARYQQSTAGLLAKRLYLAFANRRSLLLVDLQSQTTIDQIPWYSLLEESGVSGQKHPLAHAQALDLAGLALKYFPGTVLPNSLVKELARLFELAGSQVPITYELAADIFMGTFSPVFQRAAQQAAAVVGGTLYADYYGIDYAQILALTSPPRASSSSRRSSADTVPGFDYLVLSRAGIAAQHRSYSVASSGKAIEQAQILTTHNLALLVNAGISMDWVAQAHAAWKTVKEHLAKTTGENSLHHRKNAAYAWRQTVFYLALCPVDQVRDFLDSQRIVQGLPAEATEQAEAMLRGLRETINSGAPSQGPFVGWVAGPKP